MTEGPDPERPILLIDDDESFVDLIERHLRAHGYQVVTAGSIEAARTRLQAEHRPALVVLDINLPDASGWSLLRDESLKAAGSPPVVIMSGTQVRPERLRDFNVAGYLPKPVSMSLLVACIGRLTQPGPEVDAAAEQAAREVLE